MTTLSSICESRYDKDDPIVKARDEFYPGWWQYEGLAPISENLLPLYAVRCHSAEEWTLAWASKPEYIRADIRLVE